MARSSEFERAVDRYGGIAALWLVGLLLRLRGRRALPTAPRRIGLIQPTAIGDVVLMSGLLQHLHDILPQAELHVFHGPTNGGALALLPVDVVGHRCVFKTPWQALGELRAARLDVLINCAPWTRLTALLTALAGARATLGFRSQGQYVHPAYDIAVPYSSQRHETDNHRAMAEQFAPLARYRLSVRLREPQQLCDLPFERLVLLHVAAGGSRAAQKSWPAAHWAALAARLAGQGWLVGFTGAAGDLPRVRGIAEAARLDPWVCLAGRLSLPQLAHLLARARLLVTIDTGTAHLAAAVGGAVLGLYGPTRFERWGPRHARASGLNAPHPAAGYIHFGFERHRAGDAIMATLSVDAVAAAVTARLAEPAAAATTAGTATDATAWSAPAPLCPSAAP